MAPRYPWGDKSRRCIHCGQVGPRVVVLGGYAHRRCIPKPSTCRSRGRVRHGSSYGEPRQGHPSRFCRSSFAFLYPWRQLQQDARDGDLFVCHLAREAKPLIGPDNYLVKLQSAFQFRPSYQGEINRATDFGMYLARFGHELNSIL